MLVVEMRVEMKVEIHLQNEKMKNNAYRFKSNPNAKLPKSELVVNQDWVCPMNGKLWDDTEVSDLEMDREMERLNKSGMPLMF